MAIVPSGNSPTGVTICGRTLTGDAPRVIAHRGSSHVEPEHTLGAYLRAIDEGADGLECDVRLTADQHLVCVHDRRVNRTSDGDGVVSQLELAQLEGLDWGGWKQQHPDESEEPDRHHTQILTLRQLLRSVLDADRHLELVIETKHPTRWAGDVERKLVSVLREYDLTVPTPAKPRVRMMSFSTRAVARFGRLAPRLERAQLIEVGAGLRVIDFFPVDLPVVAPRLGIIKRFPEFVQRQHEAEREVHVWTVDQPKDVALCLELGVDAIITNRPGDVRSAVDQAYPKGDR